MIVDERLVTYINSLDTGNTAMLDQIEREATADYVPIIRKEMQSFLKFLLAMKKPARILEVGTAVGFSDILMAEYDPVPCQITTIENYEKRIPIARENFKRAGKEAQIALLEGDAAEVLKTLEGSYDFIFMDAAKGQYIHFLPEILRLLAKDGVLVSDNVLQDGDVIESRFAVTRRNRTIHKRMREYLYTLTHHLEHKALRTAWITQDGKMAESVRDYMKHEDAMHACENREEREYEKTGVTDTGEQSGSIKNCCDLWSRRSIYRRRSVRTPRESEELFHGRDQGGDCFCACP